MLTIDFEAVSSVIDGYCRECDDVVCFLPHSSRAIRLLFSESLSLSVSFQCICWFVDEDKSDPAHEPTPSACEGYDAFVRLKPSVKGFKEEVAKALQTS